MLHVEMLVEGFYANKIRSKHFWQQCLPHKLFNIISEEDAVEPQREMLAMQEAGWEKADEAVLRVEVLLEGQVVPTQQATESHYRRI